MVYWLWAVWLRDRAVPGLRGFHGEPAGDLSGGTELSHGACRGYSPVDHPRFGGYKP